MRFARINAEKGCPIIWIHAIVFLDQFKPSPIGLFIKVLNTINRIGVPIIMRIKPMGGKLLTSFLSTVFGAVTNILEAMNFPKRGPLITAVGIPTINPTKITQPKSAFKISATATGPGVGGIKACVIASPASNGMAYKSKDLFVFRCRE